MKRSLSLLMIVWMLFLSACGSGSASAGFDRPKESDGGSESNESKPEDLRTSFQKMFDNGPIPAQNEQGLWGYFDISGEWVIQPQFADAGRFHSEYGIAPVMDENDHWGFIDPSGNMVVQPQFDLFSGFSEGFACVRDEETNLWGYINPDGSYAIEPRFTKVGNFIGGLAAASAIPFNKAGVNNEFVYNGVGFIDTTGNWVIPPIYDQVTNFHEGIAFVCLPEDVNVAHSPLGMQMINTEGEVISDLGDVYIPITTVSAVNSGFPSAQWRSGLCIVFKEDDFYAYIDQSGNIVVDNTAFSDAEPFDANGFARAQDAESGLWGYIDTSFQYVIPPQYVYAKPFNEDGQAVVGVPGKDWGWGTTYSSRPTGIDAATGELIVIVDRFVIDEEGNMIGNFPDRTWQERVMRCGIYNNIDENNYVDINDNVVIDGGFEATGNFSGDENSAFASARSGGLWGYIDETGEWLIPPKFKKVG